MSLCHRITEVIDRPTSSGVVIGEQLDSKDVLFDDNSSTSVFTAPVVSSSTSDPHKCWRCPQFVR